MQHGSWVHSIPKQSTMDSKMAEKYCDRDNWPDTNHKMAHLFDPFELSHSRVCDHHFIWNRCRNHKMAHFQLTKREMGPFWSFWNNFRSPDSHKPQNGSIQRENWMGHFGVGIRSTVSVTAFLGHFGVHRWLFLYITNSWAMLHDWYTVQSS